MHAGNEPDEVLRLVCVGADSPSPEPVIAARVWFRCSLSKLQANSVSEEFGTASESMFPEFRDELLRHFDQSLTVRHALSLVALH